MNIVLIFFVGFIVSELPRVSVFVHCPYSVTFHYIFEEISKFSKIGIRPKLNITSTIVHTYQLILQYAVEHALSI